MRQAEAKRRGKATNYRKCYIGLKVTSVPCHTDGSVHSRYVPRKEHHPFDTSIPQTGDNFFEDMVVNPEEEPESDSQESVDAPQNPEAGNSPVHLGQAGADYLEYTRRLAQDESVERTTQTARLKLKLKAGGLQAGSLVPEVTRSASGTITPKTAPRKTATPKTAAQILRARPAAAALIMQNAKSTTPRNSPPRSRKPPIDDNEEDYEEDEESEDELRVERPSKRRKTTLSTSKTATPKETLLKSSAKATNARMMRTLGRGASPFARAIEHRETGRILRRKS
jgi:hypothetical protein